MGVATVKLMIKCKIFSFFLFLSCVLRRLLKLHRPRDIELSSDLTRHKSTVVCCLLDLTSRQGVAVYMKTGTSSSAHSFTVYSLRHQLDLTFCLFLTVSAPPFQLFILLFKSPSHLLTHVKAFIIRIFVIVLIR